MTTRMTAATAARCFAELGHPTRLAIYQRLIRAGHMGMPVGVIAEDLDLPASTLSHHLKQLVIAGLVEQTREGRVLHCRPLYTQMDALIGFLTEECCARPVAASTEAGRTSCC